MSGWPRCCLRAPDVLLLDEPTSHLDAASLEWLEGYLAAYPGAALIVSHDRQFLNRAVNHIFEIDEHTHGLKRYAGDYDAYLAAKAGERERWEESFARQQEEIKELRKRIRESARQVAHGRQPRDNDKMAYKGRASGWPTPSRATCAPPRSSCAASRPIQSRSRRS